MEGGCFGSVGVDAVQRGLSRERAARVRGAVAVSLAGSRGLFHLLGCELTDDVQHASRLGFHGVLRRRRRQAELRSANVFDGVERRRGRRQRVQTESRAEHAVGNVVRRRGRQRDVLDRDFLNWLRLVVDRVPVERGRGVDAGPVGVPRDSFVVAVGR